MEPKQYYIGIDVGGTSVKEGLFDGDGNLLAKVSVPTPPIVDAAGFAAVTEAIDQVVAKAQIPRAFVAGIGLAVPCPIPAAGDAKVKANIAINLPELKIAIQEHCPDAVVKYENDANAAAMGEAWLGSAKDVQNVVMVTIGTGVGGGVIVNGDVVSGVVGAGGEIGHMCLNPAEERTCGCGGHGHLEQYSSATGVVSNYLAECKKAGVEPIELTGPSDSKDVFQACREGDKLALAAADTMADYLGRALALIANVVDPEMFLIGGGASASADVYLDKVREYFQRYALSASRETPIQVASLGNDAGIIGSAYVALRAAGKELVQGGQVTLHQHGAKGTALAPIPATKYAVALPSPKASCQRATIATSKYTYQVEDTHGKRSCLWSPEPR